MPELKSCRVYIWTIDLIEPKVIQQLLSFNYFYHQFSLIYVQVNFAFNNASIFIQNVDMTRNNQGFWKNPEIFQEFFVKVMTTNMLDFGLFPLKLMSTFFRQKVEKILGKFQIWYGKSCPGNKKARIWLVSIERQVFTDMSTKLS